MNWKKIFKVAIIVAGLLAVYVVGQLVVLGMAVRDIDTDFVAVHNVTEVDCSNLENEILDLRRTCNYFSANREHYCKKDIIKYYLNKCGVGTNAT